MCTHEFKVEHWVVSFVYIPLLFDRITHYLVPSSVTFLSTYITLASFSPSSNTWGYVSKVVVVSVTSFQKGGMCAFDSR
jgi:hypothetical protein